MLSDGAKALFLGAEHKDHTVDTSSMGYVIQAMQRYDYVLERYGTTSYPDFIGRVDENKVVPGSLIRINFTNISDSSALFVIIAVAGAVTVICVAFAFRKKKQK